LLRVVFRFNRVVVRCVVLMCVRFLCAVLVGFDEKSECVLKQ
jgi:hypothetical protein